jgi:hypothetical protein
VKLRLQSTIVLLLLFFNLFTGLTGQSQTLLIISGKVTNNRNQPISGATLQLEAKQPITADADGNFSLNLAPGSYSLKVSAVGYQAKMVNEIDIKAGVDNFISVVLEYAKDELEGVVVTSSRRIESTNALLSFQKNSTSLSSGLAADFIRRTPDKNTGEVLKRVSGASIRDNKFVIIRGLSDRYNNAYINGALLPSSEPDKKAFSFDIIPSQLVDQIVINKTATPDLTGEFAGGLIQITTKDIPSKNLLSFGASFGFNTQSFGKTFYSNPRGKTDWLGFDDGQRKLTENYPLKFRAYNALTRDEQVAISQDFNDGVFALESSKAGPLQQYNVTWSNVVKDKKGGSFGSVLGLTYRNAKLLYPDVDRQIFEESGTIILDYADAQNRYATTGGVVMNLAYSRKKTKIAFKNLFNQLFEDNFYERSGINYDNFQDVQLRSSVLNQRSLYSSQAELTHTFENRWKFTGNINYSLNMKQQPDLRVQTFARSLGSNAEYTLNNRGNNTNRFWSDLTDQGIGYNLKLDMPFDWKGNKQLFTVGGGSLLRVREFRATIFNVDEPRDLNFLSLAPEVIFSRENFGGNGFLYNTALQNASDQYVGASALSNAFLMLDNKLSDKWRLIWGARGEYFEQVLETNYSKDVEVNTKKFDLLPSFNLTYSPSNTTNIRMAGSRTVARPEFREVAPFAFFDFEEIASTSGNSNLQRSSVYNGDIRYEMYPNAGEVLSAGAFVKSFKDPIELRLNSGSAATRRQYEFQNAESAILYGAEIEFRKKLNFLNKESEFLNNLYFNGNASVIFSEVTLLNESGSDKETVSVNRPLQGQSPYLINAGFQYDSDGGFSTSILYNHIGPRLTFVGAEGVFGDIYEKPRHLLDLQVAKKVFSKRGEVRLTVSDLLNNDILLYEKPFAKSERAYNPDIDRIYTRFTPGTTFTLGFTYDINL